jgi:hypothetical protein
MRTSLFLRCALLVAFLAAALAQETAAVVDSDCATPGECANPDAEVEAVNDESPTKVMAAEEESVVQVPVVVPEDAKCPSRPHIIRCAAANLDANKNNKLERLELETAINSLPWYSKGILKILGSVDKIMEKCDADHDGAIGIDDDMENTKEVCLATCFKRRAFKGAFFPDCAL